MSRTGHHDSRSGARSVARKLALQAIYRLQMNDGPWQDVVNEFLVAEDMPKADRTKKASKKLEEPMPASYPGLDGEPMAEGVDKEALRDTLDKADAARRKGGCTEAMSQYIEAMNMSGANSERAKARAGYGLCLSAQGDEDGADKYFDAARELSPAIDGWIKRERGDGPARKAPAKPSAKAKMDAPSDL